MTAEVIKLVKKKPSRQKRVNTDCVNLLKRALADAKAGRLTSVFVVGIGPYDDPVGGDLVFSGWSPPESVFSLLGGIESAKLEFQAKEVEQR